MGTQQYNQLIGFNSEGCFNVAQELYTKRFNSLAELGQTSAQFEYMNVDGFAFPFRFDPSSLQVTDGIYCLYGRGGTVSNPGRWVNTSPVVNVREYGADRTGKTDSSAAFTKAINYASNFGLMFRSRTVYIPNGDYRIDNTLDCTNTRLANTFGRDGLRIQGESQAGTNISGRTGTSAIFDVTGSQFLDISNLSIRSDDSAPLNQKSKVGIYQGIFTVLAQTQNQNFSNLLVQMHDEPAANNGLGTIAIWNFGAEENTYNHLYLEGNLPLLLTAYSTNPATYPTPKSALFEAHSLGVCTLSGECFLRSLGNNSPAIITYNVNSLHADNLYINGESPGNQKAAIQVNNGLYNSRLRGTVEGFPCVIHVKGELNGCEMSFHTGNVHDQTTPSVLLKHGQGWINNTDININSNEATSRPLYGLTEYPGGAVEATCYMAGVRSRSNYPINSMMPPMELIHNQSTRDIVISSASAPLYTIVTGGHHTTAISRRKILENTVVNTDFLRIIMPPYINGLNGNSILLSMRGMVSMGAPESSATALRHFDCSLTMLTPNDENSVMFVADTTLGAQMANRPLGNSIDALTFTARIFNNQIYINLAPTVSGVNGDSVYITLDATLFSSGNKYRSPYMLAM